MAIESKASVAMDNVSNDEVLEFATRFGLSDVKELTRITGGYSSSNFKIVCSKEGASGTVPSTFLLKLMYSGTSQEDAEYQLYILKHLEQHAFPTNYSHGPLVQHNGRKAMLVDFIAGCKPGQEVVGNDSTKLQKLLSDLGCALAKLHQIKWPQDVSLRDVYSGFPVCNTGDFLRGVDLEKMLQEEGLRDHPFLQYAHGKLEWLRALYKSDVPWGVIHGDAFLDNTLYEDGDAGSGKCQLKALIDWEDSCVAPFVLDLAICCSACAFTAENELQAERLQFLCTAYDAQRPLLQQERSVLPDFMLAGALACAFYRFGEFNVRQPDSGPDAKESYKIMFERAKLLEPGGAVRRSVESLLSGA